MYNIENIVHVGTWLNEKGRKEYLFLLQSQHLPVYSWFTKENSKDFASINCGSDNIVDALFMVSELGKEKAFKTLHCGFRYILPVRDEVGCNAFFHEMVSSYSSSTGTYYDKKLGHFCFVDNASQEALQLWHSLRYSL